ncbi:MAG: S8 family peptidase [Elusimicrobia bacterium]|nr:S8 family peptidase [Elusimicrobiota bacterium]
MTTKGALRTAAALAAAVCLLAGAPRARALQGPKRRSFLMTVREGTTRAQIEDAAREMGLAVVRDYPRLGLAVLESADEVRASGALPVSRHPAVVAVEEDRYATWLRQGPRSISFERRIERDLAALKARRPARPPEDPRVPWGVRAVGAPAAWPAGRGAGVRVAVIDTGVDCGHPDLRCDPRAGYNVLAPGAAPRDDNRHGTHVAGTIAGRGLGGGVLGVAPEATLLPVKVLNAQGGGQVSWIIAGLDWAARAGADVINLSLGSPENSPALERAVKGALAAGAAVVCAAGNEGPEAGSVDYPAAYPGVLAVSAASRDWIAPFSSRGREVDLIAPGVEILSTVPGGRYGVFSGTSMAAPHVAGLAALAVERGARGPAAVARTLKDSAAPVCRTAPRRACLGPEEEGAGLPNAAKLR